VYFLVPPHVPLGDTTRAGLGLGVGVGVEDARVDVWIVVLGLAAELDGADEGAAEEIAVDDRTVEAAEVLDFAALVEEAAGAGAELDCAALAEETADDATTEDEPGDPSHLPKPLWHPVPQ